MLSGPGAKRRGAGNDVNVSCIISLTIRFLVGRQEMMYSMIQQICYLQLQAGIDMKLRLD
ncbi:hypothetical protein D8B20_18595 (plasmid) [Candidatus Pantoea soli]|uniref:Uncharacterized protein n=1 Tax=Candidatus Pantoea soli TaxID=3098669 RepID=A0A518XIE1_9GAMM|nr:hypothetical protein D8B20_18595 [Pantoea soli]